VSLAATALAAGTAGAGSTVAAPARAATPPEITVVSDLAKVEGNTSALTYYLQFVRTGDRSKCSSVKVTITGGTATAGTDFTAARYVTTLAFPAGRAMATVAVRVLGDVATEADETFDYTLSDVVGATIGDGSGTFTILDDDSDDPPAFAVDDQVVTEGDAGTTQVAFTVTRSGSTAASATVRVSTVAGTASNPTDYYALSRTPLGFAIGQVSKTVKVTIVGDEVPEPEETFGLALSEATGATIADATGVGTVVDDD
jgi:hypothetical protein